MCLPVLKLCNKIQFSCKNRLYKYGKSEIGTEQIKNIMKLPGPKTKNQNNYQSLIIRVNLMRFSLFPTNIYLFKVDNKNTGIRCEMC